MRVNMDSSINNEPRFKLLARQLGIPFLHGVGCCWAVWLACYHARSDRLTKAETNASADVEGFADAMVSVGLADADGDDYLRFHGVDVRIAFLLKQSQRGKSGGKSTAGRRRKSSKNKENGAQGERLANACGNSENAEANAKRTLPQNMQSAQANTPSLTPSLAHALTPSPSQKTEEIGAKPPRPRNPLFDAIAEVTGLDPATAGGEIGKAASALSKSSPPYTPDDVREFGRRYWEICTYAKDSKTTMPTPSELSKYIGRIRASPLARKSGDLGQRAASTYEQFVNRGRT